MTAIVNGLAATPARRALLRAIHEGRGRISYSASDKTVWDHDTGIRVTNRGQGSPCRGMDSPAGAERGPRAGRALLPHLLPPDPSRAGRHERRSVMSTNPDQVDTATMTPGRAAAMWWAKQLGAPVHRATTMTADDPDREFGEFGFMAMQTIVAKHPMTDGQGDRFVEALAPIIDAALTGTDWLSLNVDYGPDLMLANAAREAGINLSRFPWKTHMSVTPMYVIASLGYRAQDRIIWQHPDWDRPACTSMRYEEHGDEYVWLDEVCGKPLFHDDTDHGDWKPDTSFCTVCGKTQGAHWNAPRDRSHTFKRPGESE